MNSNSLVRRWATGVTSAVIIGLTLAVTPAGPAEAAFVDASDCLKGDAGPRDTVNIGPGPSVFNSTRLYCGDQTKGVLHIDRSHNIRTNGDDDGNIARCHNVIMTRGDEVSASAGNRAWRIRRPSGGTATLVFDEDTREVITMFTSDSNNWAACARFPN